MSLKIVDFEKYEKNVNVYAGERSSDSQYHSLEWCIDGTGRAIKITD